MTRKPLAPSGLGAHGPRVPGPASVVSGARLCLTGDHSQHLYLAGGVTNPDKAVVIMVAG